MQWMYVNLWVGGGCCIESQGIKLTHLHMYIHAVPTSNRDYIQRLDTPLHNTILVTMVPIIDVTKSQLMNK